MWKEVEMLLVLQLYAIKIIEGQYIGVTTDFEGFEASANWSERDMYNFVKKSR